MKIVFLHLSDLHLQDTSGVHPAKIQAMVDSLTHFMPFEGIVIIFSGDIAATGQINQYKIASTFLGRLITSIKSKYLLCGENIKIIIVPGNHDIDWGEKMRPTPNMIRSFSQEERESYLQSELISMENYFSFSSKNRCFFEAKWNIEHGQLITRKILHFGKKYRIEANLINTAPFSCSSDDGLHYLPEDAIQKIENASGADLSVIVMHHSPDWFTFAQKRNWKK